MNIAVSQPAVAQDDRIAWIELSSIKLPLDRPISDAKVLTGRQTPLTDVAVLCAQIETAGGHRGFGYSYSLRSGGPAQFAHAAELAPLLIGEDAGDIARIWDRLMWQSISIGRQGLAAQAIAALDTALWDLKSKRAGLSLSRFLGRHHTSLRCYNTSGGYLQASTEEVLENMGRALDAGIGGLKMKVGNPSFSADLSRVKAAREFLGDDFPLMVDVNQQWDRPAAKRNGRALDEFNLVFLEEPLASDDAEGHAMLSNLISTPIASGEMLTSVGEHFRMMQLGSVDYLQPDAPRVGGITPFLRIMALADQFNLQITPHFVMEIHVHLMAAYPREPWVEHFEWFEPMFNERLEIRSGRMLVPDRPGLGFSLSERAAGWVVQKIEIGKRA
ncbi:enolase [Aliihoeflea aestuarii]|jgi:L-talarate/galactarate dehydratase|uniref:L-talarate/galactarate dehydratase n=1 Tax=Aliihoeflea aestuarii TaxID=453840 RepID=UPI002093786D|nr:mandelate racemase/muconate lactonizing enzyme family protein [Aliihoeflea aestuarii]MCO6389570.1 enolase [Aliihoeflea aestuarii]